MSRITKGDEEPDQPPKLREVSRLPDKPKDGEAGKVVSLPVEQALSVQADKPKRKGISTRNALFAGAAGMFIGAMTTMGTGVYLIAIGNPAGPALFASGSSILGTCVTLTIAGANKEEEDSDEDIEAK